MKYIKKFNNFQSLYEELVTNIGKINLKTRNQFKDTFGDPLKIKEFLQANLPYQNLKYLGAGCIGLAFGWLKSPPLPEEFFDDRFYGKKENWTSNKVIKFTADENEARGSKKLIDLSKSGESKINGFATYFWMKQLDLPIKWSRTFGAPAPWQKTKYPVSGIEIGSRLGDMLKSGWSYKEIEKFIKMKIDQNSVKREKAWIVCLENITMLNTKESDIAEFIFNCICDKEARKYLGVVFREEERIFLFSDEKIDDKLKKIYSWIKSDDDKLDVEFKSNIFTKKRLKGNWADISEEDFISFTNKMMNLYKVASEQEIPNSDIHHGNMGYRNGELVAFDCM
jgi:hypothetical protein